MNNEINNLENTLSRPITTNSREILLVCLELFIFPYHEIDILTRRRGGEGGEVMSDSVLCEDLLVQDFNIHTQIRTYLPEPVPAN